MYPDVATYFWRAVSPIEGVCRWPYVDEKGLVTTAMGYLVDTNSGQAPASMLALPWHYVMPGVWGNIDTNDVIASAPKATPAQIRDGWLRVKNSGLKGIGGGSQRFANLTNLRLDDNAMREATSKWIENAEVTLRQLYPRWNTMQADAQMAILNMAYAMGPAFRFPSFAAAINSYMPDYEAAAAESTMKGGGAIVDHNALTQVLLGNAARWQHTNIPADQLWWRPPGTPGANQPPSGGALARAESYAGSAPVVVAKKVGSVVGKITMGLLVFGLGWIGVTAYRSHQRGEGWTTPMRRLGSRINRAEHGAETKIAAEVSHAIQAAEGKT